MRRRATCAAANEKRISASRFIFVLVLLCHSSTASFHPQNRITDLARYCSTCVEKKQLSSSQNKQVVVRSQTQGNNFESEEYSRALKPKKGLFARLSGRIKIEPGKAHTTEILMGSRGRKRPSPGHLILVRLGESEGTIQG